MLGTRKPLRLKFQKEKHLRKLEFFRLVFWGVRKIRTRISGVAVWHGRMTPPDFWEFTEVHLQQLHGKADPLWQSNKQSYYLQNMHVHAYKNLFEHSVFIIYFFLILLHIFKRCMFPSLSKQIDTFCASKGPTDNGGSPWRQEMPVPTEMPSPTSPALAWRLSPISIQQSWLSMTSPDPKTQMVVIVREMGPLISGKSMLVK